MYKGMLCGMASFKQHATFGFWKGSLLGTGKDADAMGQFGRLTRIEDLPSRRTLLAYVKKAASFNDEGVKIERGPKGPARPGSDGGLTPACDRMRSRRVQILQAPRPIKLLDPSSRWANTPVRPISAAQSGRCPSSLVCDRTLSLCRQV